MTELVDYILAGVLLNALLSCITLVLTLTLSGKIGKQQRLTEFIYSRAMKEKKVEEHREKLEEEKLTQLKRARAGTKK